MPQDHYLTSTEPRSVTLTLTNRQLQMLIVLAGAAIEDGFFVDGRGTRMDAAVFNSAVSAIEEQSGLRLPGLRCSR